MNIDTLKEFLLWSTVINYAVLLIWFGALLLVRDRLFALHGRLFNITPEKIATIHYKAMAAYKIGILLLNLVPLIALDIVT